MRNTGDFGDIPKKRNLDSCGELTQAHFGSIFAVRDFFRIIPKKEYHITVIYDPTDELLPTEVPMVVLDGVSRPEEGGWFTKKPKYTIKPRDFILYFPFPILSARR